MWYIAWKDDTNGTEGRGQPVFWTKAACQKVCDYFNALHPDMLHWPVEVKTEVVHA